MSASSPDRVRASTIATIAVVAALAIAVIVVVSGGDDSTSSAPRPSDPQRIAYGDGPSQYGVFSSPSGSTSDASPVVVLIHGGFWYDEYSRDLMDPLAVDLVERGFAVWNIEYRRVGEPGGGYPGTLADVAAAIDHLVVLDADLDLGLDLDNVSVVGHSAGGHLALWAASRGALPPDAPGANPAVVPRRAIGQGPVVDLVAGADGGLGAGAVVDFLGTPADEPERYTIATPSGATTTQLAVVRAGDDVLVPARFTEYADGAEVEVITVPDEDHFDLIDPASASWSAVISLLTR